MKTNLIRTLTVLLMASRTLSAQTAEDYVTQGRTFLAASNLTTANNYFATAVASSPNHAAANVFYAATRLLVLPSKPAGSNFLSRIGMPVAGRNLYQWTAYPPTDTNRVPLTPAGVNANEAAAFLRTNVLPALIAAEANLAKVTNTNFTLVLTSNDTRSVGVTLDYGDVLMLRAMLDAAEYAAYTTYSWNLDAQLAAIRALYTNEELSIERVLRDYPNLLTFATTNDLAAAKLAFQNGVQRYLDASQLIRNRPNGGTRLFNSDPAKSKDEERFRLTLIDLRRSLTEAVPLAVYSNLTVFFSAQFTGAHTLRSFLPDIRGNAFVLGTLPDPTFGGLIYGITRQNVDAFLAQHLFPIPTVSPAFGASGTDFEFPINVAKDHGYLIEWSTNLLDWTGCVSFVSPRGAYSFADPDALNLPRRFYRVVDRTTNMPPPTNDDFANRAVIPAMNVPVFGYTHKATAETGEPTWAAGHTVWWSWTSRISAEVDVVTTGGLGCWAVTVFTGTSLHGLTRLYDGYGPLRFAAQAGMTYQIAVDTCWQDGGVQLVITQPPILEVTTPPDGAVFTAPAIILLSGSASDPDGQLRELAVATRQGLNFRTAGNHLNLLWTNVPGGSYDLVFTATDDAGAQATTGRSIRVAPPNDNFTNATPISGTPLTVSGSSVGASEEPGEPHHAGSSANASVWWAWTPTTTGPVTISCELTNQWGSGWPLLGVYTGTSLTNLAVVASNAAPCHSDPAQVSFSAVAATTYRIAVASLNGGYDNVTLKWTRTQPPIANIHSPTNGAVLIGPTNLTITANASDPDGSISRVDFLTEDSWIGSVTTSPYSILWSNVSGGTHYLTAKATDNTGAFTYSPTVSISVVPPNDSFANRIPISGVAATATGSNVGATKEPDEPAHAGFSGGRSVWWSWTAPSDGVMTISAAPLCYTLLAVYTGTSVSALTPVANDAPSRCSDPAQVSFAALSGTTYQIAVDTRYGDSGDIALRPMPTKPPLVNIESPTNGSALVGPTNLTITANASDLDGTVSRVDFYVGGSWIGAATGSPYSMVWSNVTGGSYSLTAKATDNAGALAHASPISFRIVPPNDSFANRIPISGPSATVTGSNVGATKEPGEPAHAGFSGGHSVWWSWTAPSSGVAKISVFGAYPVLAVYTAHSLSSLSEVASDAPSDYGIPAETQFAVMSGTTYQIAVDGRYANTGDITLALVLTQPPVVSIVSPMDHSLFVGPTNLTITADTFDPDGTIGRVDFYLEDGMGLTWVGSAANAPYSLAWNNVSVTADSYILIAKATDNAGVSAFSTPVFVSVVLPNDSFDSRIILAGSSLSTAGCNVGATSEPGEPTHWESTGGQSVWWSWTALASGNVTISTIGSNFDTILSVYTGSSVSALTRITNDDENGGSGTSLVTFPVTAGTIYQIAVDGYGAAIGSIQLSITMF